MRAALLDEAVATATLLEACRSRAGVADPDEGQVLPYSYTTEFYAWLCALLYRRGCGATWLERARQATEAALDLLDTHVQGRVTTLQGADFHWEFKNLALVHVAASLQDELGDQLRRRLDLALAGWQDLNIDSANWTAMRALSYRLRGRHLGRGGDRLRSQLELALLLSRQTADGFFPDTSRSRSLQYHAYVLSLLALYYNLTGDPRVREALLRGARLTTVFLNPDGDFNYFGRGQRQLFGYSSLIVALCVASRATGKQEEAERFAGLGALILSFVQSFHRADGRLPLVLNGDTGRSGWYSYNRYGDYLAFFGTWCALASPSAPTATAPLPLPERRLQVYPALGLAVLRDRNTFAVVSARGDDLSEPVGLVHIWPTGPACVGGPTSERTSGADYSTNYFGPMLASRPALQCGSGRLELQSNEVLLTWELPEATVRQAYRLERGLKLEQVITPRVAPLSAVPLVGVGPPPGGLHVQPLGQTLSPGGLQMRYSSTPEWLSQPHHMSVTLAPSDDVEQDGAKPMIGSRLSEPRPRAYWLLKGLWHLWVRLATRHQLITCGSKTRCTSA